MPSRPEPSESDPSESSESSGTQKPDSDLPQKSSAKPVEDVGSEKEVGGLDPSEEEELSSLAARWKRDLAPHYEEKKRRELVKTRTIKFSRQTLDLLDILSATFKTTDADVVRAMCSHHRISYSVQEETIEALMRLIGRFAGAFDPDDEGNSVDEDSSGDVDDFSDVDRSYDAGGSPSLDSGSSSGRPRHIAREMLRQAKKIYRSYKAGKRPDDLPDDLTDS